MATTGKQDKLNIQIKSIKTAMSTMFTQIDDIYRSNILNNDNRRKLSSFSEVLKRKYLTLQRYEDQPIDILTEGNEIEQFYEESTNFEILYQETLTLINDLVIKRTERTTTHTQPITESISNKEEDMRDEDSPSSADLSTVGQRPAVKLPKLEIVKFRGDYTKWQSFIDSFKATIHSSATLSNIGKFNYLRCYVTGDALNTIEGLSLTNDNYIKALELLEDPYGNKQAIITAHTKNLLKMQRVESNSDVVSLRRLYDDVQAQVRNLQSLGITEENCGTFLAPIIMELLPHEVQLNINRTLDDELWNLTRLLMIIKCEINAREICTTTMEQKTKESW